MSDIKYSFISIRRKYVNYAQKNAVLWPLMDRRSLKESVVINDLKLLHKIWREKLCGLRNKNYCELKNLLKFQYIRNCPPTIGITKIATQMRICNLYRICPWCYSRQVEYVFNRFGSYLPKKGKLKKSYLNLVEISNKRLLTRNEAGKFLSPHFNEWKKAPKNVLTKLKPLGAYYNITLDPIKINKKSLWRFMYRILAILPQDACTPDWLKENRKVRQTKVCSLKQLIPVIARSCRYPVGLMRGNEKDVIMCLNASRHQKSFNFSGCLRGRTEKTSGCKGT